VDAEGWSGAAWIGITKLPSATNATNSTWQDVHGPLNSTDTIPWCPGEPNNLHSNESCSNLMTRCAPGSPTALVNDYACDKSAWALCVLPADEQCSLGKPVVLAMPGSCSCNWLRAMKTSPLAESPSTAPAASFSTCAGTDKLALYPYQALTQPQAAAFCKAQMGPGAALVNGDPVVMAAAQGLVKSANVSCQDRAAHQPAAFRDELVAPVACCQSTFVKPMMPAAA
jgi:hypothetical protein